MIGVGEAGKQEELRPVLAGKEFTTNFQRTFTGLDETRMQERRSVYVCCQKEPFKGIVHSKKKNSESYAQVKIFCE